MPQIGSEEKPFVVSTGTIVSTESRHRKGFNKSAYDLNYDRIFKKDSSYFSNALSSLDEKQAMLIQLYYVEELNIYEIADILNISTGRVSQIKSSVLKIIRSKVTKELENNNE